MGQDWDRAPDGAECVLVSAPPVTTVAVVGGIGLSGAARVRACLSKALVVQPEAVIVDLAGAYSERDVYLTVFAATARSAAAWPGCRVVLCRPSAAMARALAGLRIGEYVTVCGSLDEAREVCGRPFVARRVVEMFAPVAGSVVAARGLAERVSAGWSVGAEQAFAVRLIVSELATNAVVHAGTPFTVAIRGTSHHLHVSVRDQSTALVRPLPVHTLRPGGRGLRLVDRLATAWGSSPTADGKVVWASVRRPD